MIIAAVELDHNSDCVCEHVECILTGIVTCMVKTVLSLSCRGLNPSTMSGNRDNGPIRNINEPYIEVIFFLTQKNTKKKQKQNTNICFILLNTDLFQSKCSDLFSI